MKKLTRSILTMSLISFNAHAFDIKEALMDYGLPCLVSFAASSVLVDGSSQNKMAIGGVGCLGIGTATYLQEQKRQRRLDEAELLKIQSMVNESVKQQSAESEKAMDTRLQAIESAQKTQLDEMRSIVREVLAERLLKLEDGVKADVNKKLESGEFMPRLEKNLLDAMKKEVMIQVRDSQKGIVEKCVEKTIQEVTAQPIGVRENTDGVQQ